LCKADYSKNELYDPQKGVPVHPEDRLPVYDRMFLKFFVGQVI